MLQNQSPIQGRAEDAGAALNGPGAGLEDRSPVAVLAEAVSRLGELDQEDAEAITRMIMKRVKPNTGLNTAASSKTVAPRGPAKPGDDKDNLLDKGQEDDAAAK
jgi:hypothetical protein